MDIGITVGALLTLAIYSFLYKDNPFYKTAEHVLLGVSVGYFIVTTITTTLIPKLFIPVFIDGQFIYIIPGMLGVFMLFRFFKKLAPISRIPLALIIGVGAGVAIPAYMQAQLIAQIKATMLPINIISNIIIIAAVLSVLMYFYFSREHKGLTGFGSKMGIYFLMIFFGSTFGYTVMARISLLIGRMQYLLGDWLGLIN
ncbi:MAG: hypothetical protein GY855_06350 [candidate division Zixibacteria bacterium]|nr:hypothetical protein [candidate division Zixibacteria bacterium]